MSVSDADFAAWLASPSARRTVLVELGVNSGGVETTRYIASSAFVSAATDTPASTYYDARLAGEVTIEESLGLSSGAATTSVGDIALQNTDGGLDAWLDDAWSNRAITIYVGDLSWPKADFRTVYAGAIKDIDGSDQNRIVISMVDKMQRLESAVSEAKLGGTTPNVDALIPLCFGECHNVTPLLTDPATLEYAVHNGPIESIIEVRDDGFPVSFTPNLATGRFTLALSPTGTITASVQGDKPAGVYSNNIGTIIKRLVKDFGRSDLRLTDADLDLSNFASFIAANTQPAGLYLNSTATVREACDQLAASVGAKLVLSRIGLLRLLRVALPATGPVASVGDSDVSAPPRLVERTEVRAACKIGYCRNWTVQESLAAGVLSQHKDLFSREWLTATATDGPAAALYKLSTDVEQENTLLLVQADAQAEANRRRDLRKVPRHVFSFDSFAPLLQSELGSTITLTFSRFGLASGVNAVIVGLRMQFISGSVNLEVMK